MSQLDSLRPVLADILEGIACAQPHRPPALLGSADTLRWCDEFDGEDERALAEAQERVEELGTALDHIGGILTAWVNDGMRQPAKFRDAIKAQLVAMDY